MSMKKAYMMDIAMAALAEGGYKDRFERNDYIPIFCGDCKHCPQGNKTFCKLAGHGVTKKTPAHKCKYYIHKFVED